MAAREHYKASFLPEVSTSSDSVWQEVVSLSFSPGEGADYIVFWSVELTNKTHTVYDAKCRVRTDADISVEFSQECRATTEYPSHSGFYRLTGGGVAKVVTLEIQSEWAGSTIFAQNANLVALRLGPGDRYAEVLERAAVTGGTSTWADLAAVTWTPDAGDYLIFAHSLTDNYTATAPLYARLMFDGDPNYEATSGHPEVVGPPKNLTPTHQLWRRTVDAGGVARTVVWQGRSHSAGTEVGFAANRVLVLQLSDFDAVHYGELTTLLTVVGTGAGALVSAAGAVASGPHLVLGSWGTAGSSASSQLDSRLVDDGAQIARSFQKSMAAASNRGLTSGHTSVYEYAAGMRNWSLNLVGDGATTSYGRPGSALAVLDLGSQGKTLAAQSAEFAGDRAAVALGTVRRLTAVTGGLFMAGLARALALGYRVRPQAEPFPFGAQIVRVIGGRRLEATAKALAFAGRAAAFARTWAAVRHSVPAETTGFANLAGAGRLLANRRLDVKLTAVVLAGLDSGLKHGRSIATGATAAVFGGAAIAWPRTYAIHAQRNLVAYAATASVLRYSGQQFWSVTPPLTETWVRAKANPEAWTPASTTPETWS